MENSSGICLSVDDADTRRGEISLIHTLKYGSIADRKIINNSLFDAIINPVNWDSNLSTDRSLRPCKRDWVIHSEYRLNFF